MTSLQFLRKGSWLYKYIQSQVAADLLCRHNRDKHHHEGVGQDRISHRLQYVAFLEMASTSVMACRLCVAFSVVQTSKHKTSSEKSPSQNCADKADTPRNATPSDFAIVKPKSSDVTARSELKRLEIATSDLHAHANPILRVASTSRLCSSTQ